MKAATLTRQLSAILLVAAAAVAIVWHFHDQNWWPPDSGAYAHIAERLLLGEVMHRDIHDHHFGLVHYFHAAVFKLFGTTIVALRYPLALFTVLQSMLVVWLLRDRAWLTALAGGFAMAALTFVMFLDPTANWYALFATILLIGAMAWIPESTPGRYVLLGVLAMLVLMVRQLTGVFVFIGLLCWLLTDRQQVSDGSKPIISRVILILCGTVLAFYLIKLASSVTLVLFGIWPLGLLIGGWRNTSIPDRAVIRIVTQIIAGAAIAVTPLALYHLWHGTVIIWIDDTVLSAFRVAQLPFIDQANYLHLPVVAMVHGLREGDPLALLNGLFWSVMLLAPALLGSLTVYRAWRDRSTVPVIAHMAVFYGLVSVHFEIANYLYFSSALTLCGLLSFWGDYDRRGQGAASLVVFWLGAMALWFHAGQPYIRGAVGIATGQRTTVESGTMGHRVGLRIGPEDRQFYEWLVSLIEKNSRPGDSILALPVNPELYFMTGRRNPTRFFNSALALRDDGDVQALLTTLDAAPPAVVVLNTRDKYVTPQIDAIVGNIRATYRRLAVRDGFEVYVRLR